VHLLTYSFSQTLKASKALLTHVKSAKPAAITAPAGKVSLLDSNDSEDPSTDSAPIWLNLTTKTHIADAKRLKPTKIALPHPLNTSSTTTICLITADPQRTYKDIVASDAFPSELGKRITKVVGIDKIKKKFSQYEAQRKLFAEHDIFLADDRIVTMLPKALGKTFYKSTAKRPVPVSIAAPAPKTDGKRIARAKGDDKLAAGSPAAIAKEIQKALDSALVHISPSASTAVKIGYATMEPSQLAANVTAVANEIIEKLVTKKWRNVKAIHIKSQNSASLPIWLADELWVDEDAVLDEEAAAEKERAEKANVGKKRKAVENKEKVEEAKKKQKTIESNDDNLDKEIKARKESLRKLKAEAKKDGEEADVEEKVVVKSGKKGKKAKSAA